MIRVAFVIVAAFCLQTAHGLQCYRCTNVEIEEDSTGIFKSLAGKSDPSCGIMPSNTVTCPDDMNACGTLNGYLSVNSFLGKSKAKVQVRDCMTDSGDQFARCRSDDTANSLVSGLLNLLVLTGAHAEVKGEVCTCKMDFCLACEGGLEIAGTCVKYWMLGLVAGGVLLLLLLCVTCCCCCGCCGCCACCRKGQRGRTWISGPSYQILTVTPAQTAGSLSVQSGDLVGYDNPLVTVAPPMGVASGPSAGYYYPTDPTIVMPDQPTNKPNGIVLA